MITEQQVVEVFNKHDPEGLLRMGAPSDEYGFECKVIHKKLAELDPEAVQYEAVLKLVHEVFAEAFAPLEVPVKPYISIAQELTLLLRGEQ